jgi:hypothetical protein
MKIPLFPLEHHVTQNGVDADLHQVGQWAEYTIGSHYN